MKKIYLALISALFCVTGSFAQTVVVAGADPVTLAGNPYTTLKGAFDNINLASQAGNIIVITVTGVTVETLTASLNQSAGPWTLLTIIPVGASEITGNINGHLVDLNGADNVTINGLNTAGNTLALNNSNGVSASTIRFINDASNNTVTNCNILGSSGFTAGPGLGTIYFSTGTATGNDNNTITQCNISASATGTPLNAVYSLGTSAVIDNSGNTISVNNISDYFNPSAPSAGISLSSFNSGWAITGNSLYQTGTRTATAANTHNGIVISSGVGYNISNNIIGFANPASTGTTNMIGYASGTFPGSGTFPTSYTPGGVANATRYNAINCSFTAGGAVSSIQNNTIGGFALYSSSGANTTFGVFCGIAVTSGNAGIGTVTGNTIGSASGTSSIYVASTTAGAIVSGIYCTTTNTITIQNNTIGGIDVSGATATAAAGFKGIEGAGTGVYTISNNNIGSSVGANIRAGYLLTGANLSNTATTATTATGTSAIQGILGASAGATLDINNNTLRGLQMSGSATTFTGINTTGAVTGAITVSNNSLGTGTLGLISIEFATSGAILCMNNSGGSATCTLVENNNIFQGVFYNAEGSGSFRCMNNSATLLSCTMNNNNFNNLTINSSGSTFGFLIGATSSTPTVVLNGNFVTTQFKNNTVTGAANLFAIGCATPTIPTGSTTITNNIFTNITFRTTTSFGAAVYWDNGNVTGSVHNINISNNTVSGLTNVGTATTAGLYGLVMGHGNINVMANNTVSGLFGTAQTIGLVVNSASLNVNGSISMNNNRVYNINSSTATSQAQGIQCAGGPTQNIFKNKIYDINASGAGTVIGLIETNATAGTTSNIYNNYIGRLYAPASGFFQAVRGISLNGTAVGNITNVYYNTVYLDGNAAANTYCVYIPGTVPVNNLRNNIFVNNAVATGGLEQIGVFVVGALTPQYAVTSNNNIIYAGTPGLLHLIYGDGAPGAITNAQQTLAAFKSFVGPTRENASMTELPPFLNTTIGANANYLHIDPSIGTQVESGAINIAGYTDDYDGDIRQGNAGYAGASVLGPDVGADEGNFTPADLTAPAIFNIAYTNNGCDLTSRIITATITDGSGINNAGFSPRIYFRKNAGAYFSSAGTLSSGTVYNGSWTFTINYATVGGVVATDLIEYFIVAQDVAATPNAGGTPSAGLTLTDVNTIITPPTTPYSYTVQTSMSGTYLVGVGQIAPNYATLTAAVADYNSRCLSGPVIFELQDVLYAGSETFPISINYNVDASAVNTLTIQPKAAVASVISASNATSLLDLTGARYVRFNGLNTGGSSLLIRNTSSVAPGMRLQNDAIFNIITNSTFESSNTNFTTTTSGAIMFFTSTGTLGNSNNTISYCDFRDRTDISAQPRVLLQSYGSVTAPNINNLVDNCKFYNFYQNGLGAYGIYFGLGTSDWTVSNNSFYQTATRTSTTTGTTLFGIFTANNVANNMQITGNYFGGTAPLCAGGALTLTTVTAGVGNTINPIFMSNTGTTTASTIQNNTIQNISLTSAPAAGASAFPFTPIIAAAGSYVIDGNMMGSGTGNGSITVNNNGAQAATHFFFVEAMELIVTGTLSVTNNVIGSYNIGGTNTAGLTAFRGILITGAPTSVSVTGNLIGSNSTANSIQNTVTTRNAPFLVMLPSLSNLTTVNLTNNVIRNLTNTSTSTNVNNYFVALNLAGINPYNITGNTLQELSSASGITTTTPGTNAMIGIFQSSTGTNHIISANTIRGLRSTSAAAAVSVYGIGINGSGSTGTVSKNSIYDLTAPSTNTTSKIYGTNNYIAGTWSYSNNMISLTNAANTNAVDLQGMHEEAGAGIIANYYFNSVHIGGSVLASAINTYAFNRSLTTTVNVTNNIFSNIRTGGTGYHVALANTNASATGWPSTASDYNDLYSSTASNVTQWLGTAAVNNLSLAGWQATQPGGSGGDANAVNVLPVFTNAATGDLHLVANSNCRLDGYGTPIAVITTDYDGQTRDAGAPDMGADEFTTTPVPSTMTMASNCDTKNVSPLGTNYIDGSCNLIARILPSGGAAVGGKIKTCVTLDGTQQTFNGEPYVQRHYDIEPTVSNQTTTSATITIYFTDAEFTLYNTTNPVWPALPTAAGGGNADPNIANVKVTQFHGVASTSPSSPGNYPGVRVLIATPVVFWNGSYWEITFNVAGFSGFYVHSNRSNTPLPVSVNYLNGRKQAGNHLLDWKVTCVSTPRATMTLERSGDARAFTGIYTITADAARCAQPFDYTDTNPLNGMNYYRLKIVDADGKITYSTTVALLNASKGFDIISIAPNPVVTDNFKLNVTNAQASKMDISIFDMQGRLVNRQSISVIAGFNSIPMQAGNLAAGTYTIQASVADERSKMIRFVKQ
ncbi:MAG: T9SS type A sorting domain-containing protein [Ferruginibacter sp.]